MRIKVKVDVRKPLKKDTKVMNMAGEWCTVNFKYEKLGVFCFVCGILGHAENKCEVRFEMENDDGVIGWSREIRADPPHRAGGRLTSRWLREEAPGVEEVNGGDRRSQSVGPRVEFSRGPTYADEAGGSQNRPEQNNNAIITRHSSSMVIHGQSLFQTVTNNSTLTNLNNTNLNELPHHSGTIQTATSLPINTHLTNLSPHQYPSTANHDQPSYHINHPFNQQLLPNHNLIFNSQSLPPFPQN
jgi:hypothetical protein